MAKNRRRAGRCRRGKTRRNKQHRARREEAALHTPLPGYLFSAAAFHQAHGGLQLNAIFDVIPEDQILAQLPPARQWDRHRGRPPYPRRALLRALVARFELGISSYDRLALRLDQDVLLKHACGFELSGPSPDSSTLEKFAQFLGHQAPALKLGHAIVVDELRELLPDLGAHTSYDSSFIPLVKPSEEEADGASTNDGDGETTGSGPSEGDGSTEAEASPDHPAGSNDGAEGHEARGSQRSRSKRSNKSQKRSKRSRRRPRREPELWPRLGREMSPSDESPLEADWGTKQYESVVEKKVRLSDGQVVDGIEVKRTKSQVFGGKLHLVNDNRYPVPLLVETTGASQADCPMILPMYRALTDLHPDMEVHYAMIDKAGDSEDVHRGLIEELGIVGIIPLRAFANREAPANPSHEFAKTVYDRDRQTHLIDPRTGRYVEFEPWGYDAGRQAVKYVCPCRRMRERGELARDASCPFYGAQCGASRGEWPFCFWLALKENWRYNCPVPRESARWRDLFCERTSVERVNSVVKGPLGLGDKRTRSLATATCDVLLSSIFLCARAVVAVRWGAPEKVGSAVSEIPCRRRRRA